MPVSEQAMPAPSTRHSLVTAALQIMRRAISGHPYRNQAELARASGISEANISRWLNGNVTPTLSKLEPVLLVLGARLVEGNCAVVPVPRKRFVARRRAARKLTA